VPELPEVEVVRRGLAQKTLNRQIVGGQVWLPRVIAHPNSGEEFLWGLTGCFITTWQRRGKYLLAALATQPIQVGCGQASGWLGVHLRMTGQLLWLEGQQIQQPLPKHTRVSLHFAQQAELRFVDSRTFGRMWLIPVHQKPEDVITGLRRLGPEPFSPDFHIGYLRQQLQRCQRPIKTALLDQSLVAGVGNIYADEALYVGRVLPTRLGSQLGPKQVQRLHASLLKVLSDSIEAGGTTFSSFLNLQGINGNYGGKAWVYGRAGEPCRSCGTLIQRLKLAGRSTHFCPKCQR